MAPRNSSMLAAPLYQRTVFFIVNFTVCFVHLECGINVKSFLYFVFHECDINIRPR